MNDIVALTDGRAPKPVPRGRARSGLTEGGGTAFGLVQPISANGGAMPQNPATPHHLPWFFASPDETDSLLIGVLVIVVVLIFLAGLLFFYLYQLPMQYSNRRRIHKVQAEIVGVLALIALFTDVHLFWIAGLLLAIVPLPDLWTPISSMAQSLQQMATRRWPLGSSENSN